MKEKLKDAQMTTQLGFEGQQAAFADLDQAIPKARAIYDIFKTEYTDDHSNWLGRWIKRVSNSLTKSIQI